ncbi:MAG: transposase [Acidobacteria bacterium]|nr:transposase [Acidobacteriota bacterium]
MTSAEIRGVHSPSTSTPLAYFITFHTYGTRLHGDEAGSVDRETNIYGMPSLPRQPRRVAFEKDLMNGPPYDLDSPRRKIVLAAILEVVSCRGWKLAAAHVRSNHVHVVLSAPKHPDRVMNDLKAYASRHLNEMRIDPEGRKRWARHGSTRWLWTDEQVDEAISYTLEEQGEPMEVWDGRPTAGRVPK